MILLYRSLVTCETTLIFQDPLNRTAAPPIIEKTKKQNKQQAPSTADLNKQVVSQVCHFFARFQRKNVSSLSDTQWAWN